MKLKRAAGFLAALLILLCGVNISAEETGQYAVTEAYTTGTTTTLFLRNAEGLTFSTGASTGDGSETLSLKESRSDRYFVLLLDDTGSMKKYRTEVNDFIRQLAESQAGNTYGIILPFSDTIHPESTDFPDWRTRDELISDVSELQYAGQATNPYLAVTDTLKLLDNCFPGDGSDLVSVILLTDGQPVWPGWRNEVRAYADEMEETLDASPEVMLFTVSFAKWTEETGDAPVISGRALEPLIEAEEPGQQIAEYCDSLSILQIRRKTEEGARTPLTIFCKDDRTSLTVRDIPTFVRTEGGWALSPGEETAPAGSEQSTPAEEADPSGEESTAPEKTDAPEKGSSGSEAPSSSGTEADSSAIDNASLQEASGSSEDGKASGSGKYVWLLCAAALLFAAGIIVFMLFRNRGRSAGRGERGQKTGLPMILQVISGNLRTKENILYLSKELWVGSDPGCEIRFSDRGADPRNSRIFVRDGVVYIEDNDSLKGTMVNGNRLYTVQRLNSGDTVTIGVISFRLKF